MEIRVDDLSGAQVQALLAEHLRAMNEVSPPESAHALDLSGLRQADVTFWSIWSGPDLAGCGALKQLDGAHAEIKSMRTADAFRRRGVATRALWLCSRYAFEEHGLARLEVTVHPGNEASLALAERVGFRREGVLRSFSEIHGRRLDMVMLALLPGELR